MMKPEETHPKPFFEFHSFAAELQSPERESMSFQCAKVTPMTFYSGVLELTEIF